MTLEQLISKAANLAPAVALMPRILKLLRSPDSSIDELIELVRLDPPLTAQILKVSNSALFAGGTQIYDVAEAINRIGFAETYRIVGMIAGRDLLAQRLAAYFTEDGEMWENSLFSAMMCEKVARRVGVEDHLAYTLGLLHGIGKFILNQYMGDGYLRLYALIEEKGCSLLESEKEIFGYDHAEVGAELLQKWKFPSEVVVPVRYQYQPQRTPRHRKETAMVHLTNYLAAALGVNYGRDANAFPMQPVALSMCNLTENDLELLFADGQELFSEVKGKISAFSPKSRAGASKEP